MRYISLVIVVICSFFNVLSAQQVADLERSVNAIHR